MKRLLSLLTSFILVVGVIGSIAGPSLAAPAAQSPPPPTKDAQPTRPLGKEPPVATLGTAPAAPAGQGVQSLSGSYVAFDPSVGGDPCYTTGQTQTFCFRAESFTNDWEYVYNLWQRFPPDWTVTNVYVQGTPTCTGGGSWGSFGWSFQTAPYEVNIAHARYQQPTDNCLAYYCFEVVSGSGIPDALESWYWDGDGYGSVPHWPCSSDQYTPAGMPTCDEFVNPPAAIPPCAVDPGVYLTPETLTAEGCNGEPQVHTLQLFNNIGVDSFFDIFYSVPTGNGTLTGPAQVYAANGATVPFDVVLTPDQCAQPGDTVTGVVQASGGGYSDQATINKTIIASYWTNEPASPVATMDHAAVEYNGKLYVVMGYGSNGAVQIWDGVSWTLGAPNPNAYNDYSGDACLGFDVAGDPVIDVLGDAATFFNIQRYNIATNSWTSLPYPAGYTGLWGYDVVSMIQHTGENVCYISGGATAPGGGNTSALWRYDPAAQTMVNLGNYTHHPVGFDFHFSWWVPWVQGGAICVAGGVDASNVVIADSQCYYIAAGAFGPPNGDLGPLPQPWWGGADGWKIHNGTYQIWGYNGVDAGFALLRASFHQDASSPSFVYGPQPLHAVYRLEGDHFADSVWAANGSTGGFTPSTLQEWLHQCPTCLYYQWDKFINGVPWSPGIQVTVQTSDTIVIEQTVASPLDYHLMETWDPAHLALLDWMATGGVVTPMPGHLEWHVEPGMPPNTLIMWFHVEPSTWTDTVLDEVLIVDGLPPEPRPVLIHKLSPLLWINAAYSPPILAGQPADFTLLFGNNGGFENDVLVRNIFPPEAPFVSSVPPPTNVDPGGLWAEWAFPGLPQGAQGSIDVTVMIQPGLPVSTTIPIWDGIFNHVGELMDEVFITFHVEQPPLTVVWDKFVDGEPWMPGMQITRQTSDTIMVQEVLHFVPTPPLESAPFVPVNVRGGAPEGETLLRVHSPATRALGQPEAPPNPEFVLWDQPLSAVNQNAYVDQDFTDFPAYSSFLADDFVNAQGWQISTIFVPGDGWNGFTTLMNASALNWAIWADCAGVPCGDPSGGGSPPAWFLSLPPGDPQVLLSAGTPGGYPSNTTLNLSAPINLPSGHWWLLFWPTMGFGAGGQYGRQASDTANGYTGQFINPGGGFGLGTAWQNWTVLGASQQDIAFRLEGVVAQPQNFAQIETWNPEHLQLVNWTVDYGNVAVFPDRLEWTGVVLEPITVTLTKWFHVEPCTWTETLLWEELWLNGVELEQRPVLIHKLPPDLWITAVGGGPVQPGDQATFTLVFGNDGGFENNVLIRNEFPSDAPFASSVPPPNRQSPTGDWAEWDILGLPQGMQGTIDVTVDIMPYLPPSTTVVIWDGIFNHVGELMDDVFIEYHVAPPPLTVLWEKYVDGTTWVPGMTITRQTSDTIVVEDVLRIVPVMPPLQGHPPAPTRPRPVSAIPQPAVEVVGETPSVVLPPPAPSDWAAPEAVLYDNGPLVTHPAGCATTDASRLQTTLGMNTLGFGHQYVNGYRMADDFTIADPAGWQIDTITFFAYQSGAPSSPSPITGVYLQIWNGPPDNPGSSVVWGDLTTNRLLSSTFSGIQRDSETTNCANNRYIFADVASVGVALPPGTYWLDWMTDGSASYSGPWAPPVTILGQTTTGNALQYTTAWAPALDSGTATPQDMPFIIGGSLLAPTFVQIETWDPAHLNLLDWAVTGGEVTVEPGRLVWSGQLLEPTMITLTKWFHVEPCTWTETLLWEELWLDDVLLQELPVHILKLPPDLWIDAAYPADVQAGELADFTLFFGNDGGFENDVWIRNEFPPEAPFVSSVPPPTNADPNGLWAEWFIGDLPMGGEGNIVVTVAIAPDLAPGDLITIVDWIFDHVGTPADQVIIQMRPLIHPLFLPVIMRASP